MDPITHFELPADDRERAATFYTSVFSWELDEIPTGDDVYLGVVTARPDADDPMPAGRGIDGAIIERDEQLRAPIVTIEVSAIDEYAQRIETAGGSIVVPKGEVPEMGYYAYFEDPEGNVIGLWEAR